MSASQDDTEARLRERDEQGDAESAFALGTLLARRGDLKEAEAAYRRADERGHPTAAAMAGVFAEANGDAQGALDAYRRADERGDGIGAFRLGMLLSRAGDWDEAREAWARADERGQPAPPFAIGELLGADRDDGANDTVVANKSSAFANPVLIGSITVLVAIVAVFLAYTANAGLPFVPTKQLKVDIADGSDLVVGNDVREGGFRIGLVSEMKPIELSNGQVGAQLVLKLTQADGNVPLDSTVSIRPRSLLGTKFVDLEKGPSKQMYADGGTLPISRTNVPVQIDDVFKTFDAKTRRASQLDLQGFGDTFTGRGSSLNDTIHSLPELFLHLQPVARYLSTPSTGLTRFFDSLNSFMGAVSPVAQTNSRLFTDMATTWEAVSRDPNALEQTIARSPSTEAVSTDSLRVQQPFLVDLTTLGQQLTPATHELVGALPQINPALEVGAKTLLRTPALNSKLQDVMSALQSLAKAPSTNIAINALSGTVGTLNPMIRYLGPYQTVCDYWNYFWTYLAEHLSARTQYGNAQRALLNFGDATQPDNVGSLPATQPAAGQNGGPEFLHNPSYGAAIDPFGSADCETGQRGYVKQLNHLDPQHRNLDTDPHTPGNQGPTFAGRARVPAGETFSRNPQTGFQLTRIPQNP